jgi:hypothetical protein
MTLEISVNCCFLSSSRFECILIGMLTVMVAGSVSALVGKNRRKQRKLHRKVDKVR